MYLVNNNRWSGSEFANGAVILVQSGGISGTGNVNYSGIGSATFSGVDSYTGATNVSGGGCLTISGTSNTNTGNFNVSGGDLFVASSASLGNSANTLTLSDFSGLGVTGNNVTISSSITLAAGGGMIVAYNGNSGLNISGLISGSGTLIYDVAGNNNGATGYLSANNTFSGGMIVADGSLDISGSGNYSDTVYGTGNITVAENGALWIRNSANIGAGVTVLVQGQANSNLYPYGGILYLATNFMPAINPASSGVIAIGSSTTSGSAINSALGSATTAVGDGYMALGGSNWTSSVYSGTSLQALVANQSPAANGTKTYYFSGESNGLNLNDSSATGALTNVGSTVMNVQLGTQGGPWNWLQLDNNNTFSGTLTVMDSCLRACANTATGSASAHPAAASSCAVRERTRASPAAPRP